MNDLEREQLAKNHPSYKPKVVMECDCGNSDTCDHSQKRVYLDGCLVHRWQMTKDEVQRWYPGRIAKELEEIKTVCPLCETPVKESKKSLMLHFNKLKGKDKAHADWWRLHSGLFAVRDATTSEIIRRAQIAEATK